MSIDGFQEILHTLSKNKLRTALTAFGVFWGIFMLILLLGAGKGIKNGIEAGFNANVQDSVWIFSRRTTVPYKGMSPGRRIQFTMSDLEAIDKLPEVLYASSENPLGSTWGGDNLVTHKDRSGNFGIFGVGDHYFEIKKYQDYRQGRRINELDGAESRKIAVIGTLVAERLFPGDESPVGKEIKINKISFTVVGLFYDREREGRNSERIYIPLSIFQKAFGSGRRLNILTYQPVPDADPYEVEKTVKALLQERHIVSPEDRNAIWAFNSLEESRGINALFAGINAFIWFVGIGTLTAGIVGISNIMIITVKERTREIGVRKALGARPINIVSTLLMESILVTSIAGYIGLVFGVGLLELITYGLEVTNTKLDYFLRPEVNFQAAMTAIVILVGVGAVAGFIPAWHAAKISPIEALRSE